MSEHPLTVLELEQPPGAVDGHTDHVEAEIVGAGPGGHLGQPAGRDPADLGPLAAVAGFERRARAAGDPSRLDLDECQQPAIVRDQVELTPAGAVVAPDDP